MRNDIHYSIRGDKTYFMPFTVVDWIDVFTTANHKMFMIESLKFCQDEKGLTIVAWCLMPNHLHIIAFTKPPFKLADVVRDFKKFTSKGIIRQI